MKSYVVLSIFLILCVNALTAQELLTPLNGGQPVEQGTINEPVVMQNAQGDLFLVYVKEGALIAQRSQDGGKSFNYISIDFKSRLLSDYSALNLYERSYQDWVVFFKADEGGQQGIYALECAENGGLRLAYEGALDDTGLSGEIVSYEIHPDRRSGFYVVYNKGGSLGFRFVEHEGVVRDAVVVSGAGEHVEGFEWKESKQTDDGLQYCVYVIKDGNNQQLYYFEVILGKVSNKLLVGNFNSSEPIEYQVERVEQGPLAGNVYVAVNSSSNLFLKCVNGTSVTDLNKGVAINDGKGSVVQFEGYVCGHEYAVLFVSENNGKRDLYEISVINNIDIFFNNSEMPINLKSIKNEFKLLRTNNGLYYLGFIEENDDEGIIALFNKNELINNWNEINHNFLGISQTDKFILNNISDNNIIFENLNRLDEGYEVQIFLIPKHLYIKPSLIFHKIIKDTNRIDNILCVKGLLIHMIGSNCYLINPILHKIQSLIDNNYILSSYIGNYFVFKENGNEKNNIFRIQDKSLKEEVKNNNFTRSLGYQELLTTENLNVPEIIEGINGLPIIRLGYSEDSMYNYEASENLVAWSEINGDIESCYVWDRNLNEIIKIGENYRIYSLTISDGLIVWNEYDGVNQNTYNCYAWDVNNREKTHIGIIRYSHDFITSNGYLLWNEYDGNNRTCYLWNRNTKENIYIAQNCNLLSFSYPLFASKENIDGINKLFAYNPLSAPLNQRKYIFST